MKPLAKTVYVLIRGGVKSPHDLTIASTYFETYEEAAAELEERYQAHLKRLALSPKEPFNLAVATREI